MHISPKCPPVGFVLQWDRPIFLSGSNLFITSFLICCFKQKIDNYFIIAFPFTFLCLVVTPATSRHSRHYHLLISSNAAWTLILVKTVSSQAIHRNWSIVAWFATQAHIYSTKTTTLYCAYSLQTASLPAISSSLLFLWLLHWERERKANSTLTHYLSHLLGWYKLS